MKRMLGLALGVVAVAGVVALSLFMQLRSRATPAPAPADSAASPSPLALPALVSAQPQRQIALEDREGVRVTRRPYGGERPTRRENPREEETPSVSAGALRPRGRPVTVSSTSEGLQQLPGPASTSVAAPSGERARAPFGRALKCELVFTLESINERTPIVALVAEDQWWDGRLVIPAGTEAHGMARMDRLRDRILSDEEWVLVLPRGKGITHGTELRLRGMALDRDQPSGNGVTWGLTDGSSGLRGRVIRTTDPDEIRLLATTFLSAATRSLRQTSVTTLGATVAEASPRNAAVEGTGAALDVVAGRILEEVRRNGSYLQVPAGKQFYLYLTQTVEIPLNR